MISNEVEDLPGYSIDENENYLSVLFGNVIGDNFILYAQESD